MIGALVCLVCVLFCCARVIEALTNSLTIFKQQMLSACCKQTCGRWKASIVLGAHSILEGGGKSLFSLFILSTLWNSFTDNSIQPCNFILDERFPVEENQLTLVCGVYAVSDGAIFLLRFFCKSKKTQTVRCACIPAVDCALLLYRLFYLMCLIECG